MLMDAAQIPMPSFIRCARSASRELDNQCFGLPKEIMEGNCVINFKRTADP